MLRPPPRLSHYVLLGKLLPYGIRGTAYTWPQSYPENRVQFCKQYNGVISKSKPILFGVQQGSILVPLLFLLYMNDLSTVSDSLFVLAFADDTNIFVRGRNILQLEDGMNAEVAQIV